LSSPASPSPKLLFVVVAAAAAAGFPHKYLPLSGRAKFNVRASTNRDDATRLACNNRIGGSEIAERNVSRD